MGDPYALNTTNASAANVTSVAPMLLVTNMEKSVAYYVNGLGFTIINTWMPDGNLRWCWMELGAAALMLQQLRPSDRDQMGMNPTMGAGAALYFQCQDAVVIYRQAIAQGLE